jgi:hypothetical protein
MNRTLVGTAALLALSASLAARPLGEPQATPFKPMRIALVVDTSAGTSSSLHLLRASLAEFVDTLPPGPEMLLASTGRRMQVRVPPTADHQKVAQSLRGLTADGGPTPLIDAVLEIDERFMRKPTLLAPVYVIVTGDGSENSAPLSGEKFNAWLQTLSARGVAAHAVVLKTGVGLPEQVVKAMTQATRGHFGTIGNAAGLGEALKPIAERIRAAYEASARQRF